MTMLLAWLRGDEAMLCFDSAVTGKSGDLPTFEVSSFGEKQDVDGVPVEERVLKLVDVAGMPGHRRRSEVEPIAAVQRSQSG